MLPTGKESEGLGNGYWIYEPFAMWGQFIGTNGFLQLHSGLEIPSDSAAGKEGFLRTALGYTLSQDQGFGRAWSPMMEVIVAKPEGGSTEWDLVPQVQVSLSKLQHVLLSVGVRVPLNEREERKPQVLTYVLVGLVRRRSVRLLEVAGTDDPIRRLLPLACLLWLASFVASPNDGGAAQTSNTRSQPASGLVDSSRTPTTASPATTT